MPEASPRVESAVEAALAGRPIDLPASKPSSFEDMLLGPALPDLPPQPLPDDLPPPPPFVLPGREGDKAEVPAGADKSKPEVPRPAAAVIVKGGVKPAPKAEPARPKVHVLAEPGRAEASGVKPVAEIAPSTAALVSAALAVGRVTPPSVVAAAASAASQAPVPASADAPSPSAAPAEDANAPAKPSARAPSAAARAATPAAPGDREPDAPVLRRDRRTHPLGWAIQSSPSPAAIPEPPGLPPTVKPRSDQSSSGLVDPQAIVEATSVTVQPGVPAAPVKSSSLLTLVLLAVAAGLLILFVLIYGS